MSNVPRADFSDLERARALSRRLERAGRGTPGGREAGYVRFHRAGLPGAPGIAAGLDRPPAAAPEPATPNVVGYGARRWGILATWLLEQVSARATLLMDPHGLLLAVEGPMDVPEVETVGARLMESLSQAGRMFATRPDGMRIDIAFGEFHLVGFEVDGGEVGSLTVGLLGTAPVPPAKCTELKRTLEQALHLENAAAGSVLP